MPADTILLSIEGQLAAAFKNCRKPSLPPFLLLINESVIYQLCAPLAVKFWCTSESLLELFFKMPGPHIRSTEGLFKNLRVETSLCICKSLLRGLWCPSKAENHGVPGTEASSVATEKSTCLPRDKHGFAYYVSSAVEAFDGSTESSHCPPFELNLLAPSSIYSDCSSSPISLSPKVSLSLFPLSISTATAPFCLGSRNYFRITLPQASLPVS